MPSVGRLSLVSVTFILCSLSLLIPSYSTSQETYGKGFYNHSGCLYAYQENGNLSLASSEGETMEDLKINHLEYDFKKTLCAEVGQPGKIVFSFKIPQSKDKKARSRFKAVTISMRFSISPSEGSWEINQANLTLISEREKRKFKLAITDRYADLDRSYSCSELKLQTLYERKPENASDLIPAVSIILRRFQLQPFSERFDTVFAPSVDCSKWVSIPGLMGLVLVVFITAVTIIGIMLLQDMQTNDFKFNKEGLQFTQAQMESNKRSS